MTTLALPNPTHSGATGRLSQPQTNRVIQVTLLIETVITKHYCVLYINMCFVLLYWRYFTVFKQRSFVNLHVINHWVIVRLCQMKMWKCESSIQIKNTEVQFKSPVVPFKSNAAFTSTLSRGGDWTLCSHNWPSCFCVHGADVTPHRVILRMWRHNPLSTECTQRKKQKENPPRETPLLLIPLTPTAGY